MKHHSVLLVILRMTSRSVSHYKLREKKSTKLTVKKGVLEYGESLVADKGKDNGEILGPFALNVSHCAS